jgi:hypothetical protein
MFVRSSSDSSEFPLLTDASVPSKSLPMRSASNLGGRKRHLFDVLISSSEEEDNAEPIMETPHPKFLGCEGAGAHSATGFTLLSEHNVITSSLSTSNKMDQNDLNQLRYLSRFYRSR